MPGFLTPDRLERPRAIDGTEFDRLFVAKMTYHHAGAVKMADSEIQGSGDLRLKLMASRIGQLPLGVASTAGFHHDVSEHHAEDDNGDRPYPFCAHLLGGHCGISLVDRKHEPTTSRRLRALLVDRFRNFARSAWSAVS